MNGCDKSIDEVPMCPYREFDEFRNRVCRKDEGTICPGEDAPALPDFVPPHEQGVIVVLAEPPAYNSPNEQMKWSEELRETLLGNIITCADEPFVTSSKNIAGGGTLAPDCLHFLIGTGTALRKWAAQHKRLDWEAMLEPRDESAPARATDAEGDCRRPDVPCPRRDPIDGECVARDGDTCPAQQAPECPLNYHGKSAVDAPRPCDQLLATSCPWRELQPDRTLRCNAAAGQGCRANEAAPTGALAAQVGGDHYKSMKIQPVEYIHRNGLGFIEGCVIKYVSRWRAKNGIQDLEKARHFINLLIELEGKK